MNQRSKAWLCSAALIVLTAAAINSPAVAQESAIPNFMSTDSGWLLASGINFRSIAGEIAPIGADPTFRRGAIGNGQVAIERIADAEYRNLKPWATAQMKMHNDLVRGGHRAFMAQSRCWPGGVPGQLLFPAEPIFFIQQPEEVWIIWQRDHHVRRVYLNRAHSENLKPSWFGESIGHYENGELVIDTIGFIEHQYSFVDNYRTPHTKDLHVVERWKMTDGGRAIEATVRVEDPGTFNAPWSGLSRWQKVDRGPLIESICAENNLNYERYFRLNEYPMPEAKTLDF